MIYINMMKIDEKRWLFSACSSDHGSHTYESYTAVSLIGCSNVYYIHIYIQIKASETSIALSISVLLHTTLMRR